MSSVAERWFATRVRRPQAPVRLYCLPYAGGSASAYLQWAAALGEEVEVSAVLLPGRGGRMAEPAVIDPAAIAAAIAETADRPFALYGHSMGAQLAFEVARALRARPGMQPFRLLVGACLPPDQPPAEDLYAGLSHLGDAALVERLSATGSLPEEVLAEPELLDLLLPVFRTDLGWLDRYEYREQPPLRIPITAIAGATDASATAEQMEGWRAHTAAGFKLHVLPGGHLFLNELLDELSALIRSALAVPEPARPVAWSVR